MSGTVATPTSPTLLEPIGQNHAIPSPKTPELEGRWGVSHCSTVSSQFSPCSISFASGTRYPSSELESAPVPAHLAWASTEMLAQPGANLGRWDMGPLIPWEDLPHTCKKHFETHAWTSQTDLWLWPLHCILRYAFRSTLSPAHVHKKGGRNIVHNTPKQA